MAQGFTDSMTLSIDNDHIMQYEYLSYYISVFNTEKKPMKNVGILVTQVFKKNSKILLNTMNNRTSKLFPNKHDDHIININTENVGKYRLNIEVTFSPEPEIEFTTSTQLDFIILNPIQLKTSTVIIDSSIFLEVQIKNRTKKVIFIKDIILEPTPCFKVHNCNTISSKKFDKEETFTGKVHLDFGDQRQYLYKLTPLEGLEEKAKHVTVIGNLSVVWRGRFGNTGKYKTNDLEITLPKRQEIEISIHGIPENIYLEEMFQVDCSIKNCSNDTLPLKLSFLYEQMHGIIINGKSGLDLGEVTPKTKITRKINLFPISSGIQEIRGIIVTNLKEKKKFLLTSPVKVVVMKNK
ncbi:hypothetical protein M0813_21483 [Anaeramoeba flamelloides]|nr:hypothetical protein M0813_21483 [Anaeramoeba flamelloides]